MHQTMAARAVALAARAAAWIAVCGVRRSGTTIATNPVSACELHWKYAYDSTGMPAGCRLRPCGGGSRRGAGCAMVAAVGVTKWND
jgi:hypothetical protein